MLVQPAQRVDEEIRDESVSRRVAPCVSEVDVDVGRPALLERQTAAVVALDELELVQASDDIRSLALAQPVMFGRSHGCSSF